jgi:poly-gamma-glutamate synthesis protein (capsule biosynthesis protein)
MQQYGYAAPFSRTAADLRAADITVGNLEGVLSDVYAPPKDPHTLTFVSSLKAIDGYLTAGFDALSLANNHAGNAGPGPLTETLAALKKKGILPFGAGLQRREAHSPAIITAKGVRFAFLGYEDVFRHLGYPGLWVATDTKPGTADLGDGNEAVRDIWAAHRQADVVVVFPHWGVEYTAVPTQRQREMARRFIDAGADAVVGAHPHWVQAVEFYKGRPIVYSLGNFVFDQMFSIETRQGIVLHMRWSGKHLISLTMKPILIEDYYQPRFIPTSQGWAILARMMNATRALMRQDATSPLPSR